MHSAGDDDGYAVVLDFFPDDLLHLFVVLLQGHYDADVLGAIPMPAQMASRRPVPAESCPPVMAVVSLSEMTMVTSAFSLTQSSSPVMPEWVKVESPMTATAGCRPASEAPFAIKYGGAHIHARVNGVEWGIGSQRVATNVAEHLISGIFFFNYLGQHRVHVAMAATLAQSGRAHLYQRRNAEFSLVLLAYWHVPRCPGSALRL